MKTVIQTVIITSAVIFTGINTLDNKTLKQKEEIVLPKESTKIYRPVMNQISPTCPSAEYQLATFRQAEGQLPLQNTEHCTKCSLGALYEKDEKKVCSYCETAFSL